MDRNRIRLDRLRNLMLATAAGAVLSACGGGSGTSTSTPTDSSPTPPGSGATVIIAPDTSATATPVSPSGTTFTAARALFVSGNEALDWINAQRDGCGAGALVSDTVLQTIANNHSSYLLLNGLSPSHVETAGLAGFTGLRIGDRASGAGYAWSLAIEGVATSAATDLAGMRSLMSLPYHRIAMLDHRLKDVGIASARATSGTRFGLGMPVIAAAVKSGEAGQALASTAQGTCVYPAAEATQIPIIAQAEYPNPVPELGAWGAGILPGYPVSIQVPADKVLDVASFSITEPSGRTVPVKIIDRNDPIKLKADGINHWAFAVPLEALKPSTRYTVSFTGTASSTPVARNWAFTTRAAQTSVESVRNDGSTTVIRLASAADYANIGTPVPSAACGAGYAFTASFTNFEVVIRHTAAAPAAGCSFSIPVSDVITRAESTVVAVLPATL